MSLSIAEVLLQIIIETYPRKKPIIKKLANNEHVILLNDGKYVWTMRDWYEHLIVWEQEEEGVEA